MALSYAVYPADGTTTQFDLTFGYLRKSHVFVFVDGELVGFKWVSPTRVELITVPDPEQFVRIQRLTDRSSRITDFTDGQTLLAGDLNAGDLQNFYILQELLDQIVDGVLTGAVPVLDNGSGYITEQWISEQLNGSLEQSAALTELSNRIIAEEIARAQAIATEAQQRLDGLATEAAARADAVLAEANARAAALNIVASDLTDEVTTRASQVAALGSDLAAETTARVLGDDTLNAAIVAESTARQSDSEAFATTLTGIVTRQDNTDAAVLTETTARSTADDALSQLLTVLTTRVGDAEADIVSEQQARTTSDTAIASDVTLLTTRMGDAEADILSEQTARADADTAIATDVSGLLTRMGDAEAGIVSEQTARSTADSALSSSITALTSQVDNNAAAVVSESATRADADNVLASSITTLTSQVDDNSAAVVSESATRANADNVLASSLNALTVRTSDAEADIASVEQAIVDETSARVNDIAVATAATAAAQADATNALSLVATEESSRLTEVSRLDVQFKRGETSINLLRNGHFTYDPVGTAGVPSGWAAWAGNPFIINQDPDNPDRAVLHMDATSAFPGYGIQQSIQNVTPGATYVVTVRVRRLSGTFAAAGVHVAFRDASQQTISSANLSFAADGNLEGANALTPDGVVTYSKTVTAPVGAVHLNVYLMAAWTAFGTNTGCQIDWLEASVKAADVITETALNAQATAANATVLIANETAARATETSTLGARLDTAEADITSVEQAIANETSARASAVSALGARLDTAEADITSVEQAIVDETSARVDDIAAANASTAAAQADATNALSLVANETAARSTAFNSLDARVVSSLSNDADFIKNPSAAYGTAVGYSGNRTGRNVGVTIATDSGVPSGAAFSRAGTDTYVHKPGYGVGASDLGWYKEGGWGGTSIRIRGWFKTPDPSRFAEVGVHLFDTNFLNPAWPRVPVSAAAVTDWVWHDEVFLISPSYTQELMMPFIRCSGSGTNLVMYEQLSWADVSTVQDLSDTVSTQAASIASTQLAIADETSARTAAVSVLNSRVDTVETTANGASVRSIANEANISSNALAISNETSARAALDTTLTASVSGLSSTVSTQAVAIADLENGLSGRLAFGVTSGSNAALFDLETGQEFGSAITLTAAQINLNGNVLVNGTVLTDAIADGAMSTVEYFTNDLGIAITAPTSGTATPWIGIASKVLQVDVGRSVMVQAAAAVQASVDYSAGGFDPQADIRIRRGSTVIREIQSIIQGYHIGNGFNVLSNYVSIPEIDSPPPGTYTYTVEVRIRTTAGNASTLTGAVSNRTLILTEFKR